MNRKIIALLLVLIVSTSFTSGCSTFSDFKGVWKKDKSKKEEGERIPILKASLDLKEDLSLSNQTINLPDIWDNKLWPQSGGYPNKAMGQLELGKNLKKAWSVYIGSEDVDFNPLTIQPIVVENTIYTLDSRSRLSAFDIARGKKKWEFSINPPYEERGALGGGIAYSSGKIYAANGYKQLLCIKPDTGELIWSKELPSPSRSAPTVSSGKIYVITLDNHLIAMSEKDGEILWTYSGIKTNTNLLGSAAPTVDPDLVVLPLSTGELIGLRPENGQIAWHDNIASAAAVDTAFTISDIRAQPVIDQGLVYASSYSGRMVALDAVTGQRVWQQQIGSTEMPWSAGDAIYIIDKDQKLIALNRKTGGIYWIKNIQPDEKDKEDRPVWKGPILAGGRLIIASNKGKLLEINPQNGDLIRRIKIGDGVVLSPLVANKTLFLLTDSGEVVAYR